MSNINNEWIPEEFEEIRSLGSGGYATVFIVRHKKFKHIRALKVLEETIEDEEDDIWKRFIKECRTLLIIGNGGNPNIVKVYYPRLINHRAVVEMDYVKGDTVQSYIHKNKYIPYKEFVKFAEQIVGAVAYCHVDIYRDAWDPVEDGLELDPHDGTKYKEPSAEKRKELIAKYEVVHNDLHSGNIIRRENDGQYILIDFGLSLNSSDVTKTTSRFSGAIEYSSPEKLLRQDITAQSDVYSLGVLMYQFLTGQVPYIHPRRNCEIYDSDRKKECQRRRQELPVPIYELRKKRYEKSNPGQEYKRDYPERLDEIIMKCIAYDASDRYENAKELLFDLKKVFESIETPESAPINNDNTKDTGTAVNIGEVDEPSVPDVKVTETEQDSTAEKLLSDDVNVVSDGGDKRQSSQKFKTVVIITLAVVAAIAAAVVVVMLLDKKNDSSNPIPVAVEDSNLVSESSPNPTSADSMEIVSNQAVSTGENSGGEQNENMNDAANQESVSNDKKNTSESETSVKTDDRKKSKGVNTTKQQTQTTKTPTTKQPQPQQKPKSGSISLGYGTWKGGIKNGKPDGKGKVVFKSTHKVDKSSSCVANPGDYFIATYDNGQLVYGVLYDSSGKKLKTVIP